MVYYAVVVTVQWLPKYSVIMRYSASISTVHKCQKLALVQSPQLNFGSLFSAMLELAMSGYNATIDTAHKYHLSKVHNGTLASH
jgi:hypothetical protein